MSTAAILAPDHNDGERGGTRVARGRNRSRLLLFMWLKEQCVQKRKFSPNSLAMKPTRRAAMIVPSLTPSRRCAKISESTAAMTVSDTSNATFVVPNSVFHVEETARTNDSPAALPHLPVLLYIREAEDETPDQKIDHTGYV